jgi:hypothetical protein
MEPGRYSTRGLVATMRAVKANPQLRVKTGEWTRPVLSNSEYRAWFLRCLDTKINRALPQTGRKLKGDYQQNLRMDVRTVNDYYGRRARSSGSSGMLRTPELRRRYPHVNCQERDY